MTIEVELDKEKLIKDLTIKLFQENGINVESINIVVETGAYGRDEYYVARIVDSEKIEDNYT